MTPPRVSVAIPVHNEESVVCELITRVTLALDALPGGPHEIVFVDDGSTDRTQELLCAAALRDSRIVVLVLSRNFGHQAALSAALDHVAGDVTILMDGDLQDPPEVIPDFIAHYAHGYDVVYAKRIRRKEPWWLRLSYHAFYRLLARLADIHVPTDAGDFGLVSRRVVDQLRLMRERHRYLRGLRSWVGFKQIGIDVERAQRHSGNSKYTIRRLLHLALDALFSFSIVPLRLAAILGAVALACSTLYALYAVYARAFLQQSPAGFTALLTVITFMAGAILICLGVIGEYLGRVYEELKSRPVYIVSAIVRAEAGAPRRAGMDILKP
jgi:polyisoprenyl-phosphate glycosyltransferase